MLLSQLCLCLQKHTRRVFTKLHEPDILAPNISMTNHVISCTNVGTKLNIQATKTYNTSVIGHILMTYMYITLVPFIVDAVYCSFPITDKGCLIVSTMHIPKVYTLFESFQAFVSSSDSSSPYNNNHTLLILNNCFKIMDFTPQVQLNIFLNAWIMYWATIAFYT